MAALTFIMGEKNNIDDDNTAQKRESAGQ